MSKAEARRHSAAGRREQIAESFRDATLSVWQLQGFAGPWKVTIQFHREGCMKIEMQPVGFVRTSRQDLSDSDWGGVSRVGILAQRGSPRPNRMGATICRIVKREGRCLHVVGLDAADGTPVIDLKPVMREFLPREPTVQPQWATE